MPTFGRPLIDETMSGYSEFFAQDFASRCRDLLDHFYAPAKAKDREVTLLLAVAAAGLVVPYERLSPLKGQAPLDRQRYQSASDQLLLLMKETVGESQMVPSRRGTWQGGLLESASGSPDEWPELRVGTNLPDQTPVSDLVAWLRHGLAHGNIVTRPGGARQLIERIVFVCGYPNGHPKSKKNPLRYVSVRPDDLKVFLHRWFDCLAAFKIPRDVMAEVLDACEAA